MRESVVGVVGWNFVTVCRRRVGTKLWLLGALAAWSNSGGIFTIVVCVVGEGTCAVGVVLGCAAAVKIETTKPAEPVNLSAAVLFIHCVTSIILA